MMAMDPFVRDEAFLLRCASTFNWTPLIERCRLIKEIFSSTAAPQSPVYRMRLAAASQQLQARDEWQNTALHLACFHNAPIMAIEALLEAASAGKPPIQLATFLSADNSSPLLIACATNGKGSTVEALLEHSKEDSSNTELLAGYPDDQGETPLSGLWKLYVKRRNTSHRRPKAMLVNDEQLWRNTETILNAAWSSSHDDEYVSKLHLVANMAESFPPLFTERLLQHYPDTTSLKDERGMLPLHCAICTPTMHPHQNLKDQRAFVIQKLLDLYPEAARTFLPGKKPRSPFCTAIASGLDWHSTLPEGKGPLLILWQCAPQAIPSRDAETGLYPFLLAATIHTQPDNDPSALNNVYNILRLYPQVIQDMLST